MFAALPVRVLFFFFFCVCVCVKIKLKDESRSLQGMVCLAEREKEVINRNLNCKKLVTTDLGKYFCFCFCFVFTVEVSLCASWLWDHLVDKFCSVFCKCFFEWVCGCSFSVSIAGSKMSCMMWWSERSVCFLFLSFSLLQQLLKAFLSSLRIVN